MADLDDPELRRDAADGTYPPLLLYAAYVFDFTVIHPFRDGNGRMSRLITLWLLYVLGHDVGRFISLEKLIDDSKDSYYDTLGRSTAGCCSERLLGVIRSATSASMRALGARMFSIAFDDSVLWIKATCRSVSRPAGL